MVFPVRILIQFGIGRFCFSFLASLRLIRKVLRADILVADAIVSAGGKANPTVVLAAAFQVLYAMDALFFEAYYFYSHDALNTGFGFSLVSTYLTFPFLPTLITRYLLDRNPAVQWYYLVLIGIMNAVGYVIFRSSE